MEIYSILIDDGDITAPDSKVREEQVVWIQGWIDTASALEAAAAHVIADKASIPVNDIDPKENEIIRLSADLSTSLYAHGQNCGVKVFTENSRPLSLKADHLIAILELCDGQITICADFGHFKGSDRYAEFAKISPYAMSVHAKAQYQADGTIIPDDLAGGIKVLKQSGFAGLLSLIFDRPIAVGKTEWNYLDAMKKAAYAICKENAVEVTPQHSFRKPFVPDPTLVGVRFR